METKEFNENINRLKDMQGGTYMYGTKNIKIQRFEVADLRVAIFTDGVTIYKSLMELGSLLDEFLPVSDRNERALNKSNKESDITDLSTQRFDFKGLEDILMDSIEKVQNDANYIPQANMITKNVDAIVKIQKTKIEIAKEFRKRGQ